MLHKIDIYNLIKWCGFWWCVLIFSFLFFQNISLWHCKELNTLFFLYRSFWKFSSSWGWRWFVRRLIICQRKKDKKNKKQKREVEDKLSSIPTTFSNSLQKKKKIIIFYPWENIKRIFTVKHWDVLFFVFFFFIRERKVSRLRNT